MARLHAARAIARGDLFGEALDVEAHALVIDATKVGSTIVRVFTGLLVREFGEDAFEVERVDSVSPNPQEICA